MTMVISFVAFLFIFMVVGLLANRQKANTAHDYLLAGQKVKPWLVALSALATNNSGYMFIGVVGYTYVVGLSSIWVLVGIIFGDFLASLFIHKKLRVMTESQLALSFPEVLSKWGGTNYKTLRRLAGIITILFLGAYAAAQLNAGSKALHVLFGWDYRSGAILGAVIVLVYCFAGGIRASIWTDAVQSFIMILAMAVLFFATVSHVGGFAEYWTKLHNAAPGYMDIWPKDHIIGGFLGGFLFILGWIFVGLGVVGQPQIMVRFMAMEQPEQMHKVRLYYYAWFILFSALTIGTALGASLIIPADHLFDAELALPLLAETLLPQVLVGLVLAGLFASTLSTADSQILSCSASLTRDMSERWSHSHIFAKFSTLAVTLIALFITLGQFESVFNLVILVWSVLAAAFGPLLLIYSLGSRPSERVSILMMMTGMLVVLWWKFAKLDQIIVEIAPGVVASLAVFFFSRLFAKKHNLEVD